MDTTRQTRPATDADRRRLAELARTKGVQIRRDTRDGRHYASSVSHPGRWHYVTSVSCDCPGFMSHARCMHHSALLAALGWLPPLPPAPVEETGDEDLAAALIIDGRVYARFASASMAESARSSLQRWASTATRMDVRPAA